MRFSRCASRFAHSLSEKPLARAASARIGVLSHIRHVNSSRLSWSYPAWGAALLSVSRNPDVAPKMFSTSVAFDKVMTVQQHVHCEVGCNDDERGRGQELKISVTVWDALQAKLLSSHADAKSVLAQRARAESAEWQAHAERQLQATHDNHALTQTVSVVAQEGRWFTIEAMADCIAREVLAQSGAPQVTVLIDKPDALRKRGVRTAACEVTRTWDQVFAPDMAGGGGAATAVDRVMTLDQAVHCEVGCRSEERGRLQEVRISVTVWDSLRRNLLAVQPDFDDLSAQKVKAASADWRAHAALQLAGTHNNALLAKTAQRVAEEGRWFTIEAMADALAAEILAACPAPKVTVRVEKPQALREWRVSAAACEVTRTQADAQ